LVIDRADARGLRDPESSVVGAVRRWRESSEVVLLDLAGLALQAQLLAVAAADVVVAVDGSALELALFAARGGACVVTIVPSEWGYAHLRDHRVMSWARTYVTAHAGMLPPADLAGPRVVVHPEVMIAALQSCP
jgi:hypothetical protein